MLNLSGDDRYFARLNWYETGQTGDAPLAPGGAGINQNYFTQAINPMLDYLQQRQLITAQERDANFMSFSAMTIDTNSRGVEVEFVANPIPNWTLRASYSYTDTSRDNYFPEREPHLTRVLTLIRSRDDRGLLSSGLTIEQQIASLLAEIDDTAARNEVATTGVRPSKGTVTTRYRWSKGALKGTFVGASVLYQSAPYLQLLAGKKVYGEEVRDLQLFAGTTYRLPRFNVPLRVQLNVYNVTNDNLVQPGRYTGDGLALYRVYLRAPRNFRLSATVEF
jgi:outer membrane receptor protein involved in Fe transport